MNHSLSVQRLYFNERPIQACAVRLVDFCPPRVAMACTLKQVHSSVSMVKVAIASFTLPPTQGLELGDFFSLKKGVISPGRGGPGKWGSIARTFPQSTLSSLVISQVNI